MSGRGLLERVLEPGALTVQFQPVVDVRLSRRTHYVEGLVRGPRGSTLERTEVLLEYVRRKGAEAAFDRAAVRAVLEAAGRLPGRPIVGLNVHATTLATDLEFLSFLADTAQANWIPPEQLVVEIVEHAAPQHAKALAEALAGMRAIGMGIALDDVGCGQSNYKMMLDCRPTYFKVGAYLVRGAADDFYRQAVLRSIVELGQRFGARVVAGGVDSLADLDAVCSAGVPLVQGLFVGEPLPAEMHRGAAAERRPHAARGSLRMGGEMELTLAV